MFFFIEKTYLEFVFFFKEPKINIYILKNNIIETSRQRINRRYVEEESQ
jgi:hypothetical protein